MFIVVSPFFIRHFTPKNTAGITILPFIIIKSEKLKADKDFINHEKIHIQQQAELLMVFFIILYYGEFIWRFIKTSDYNKAYRGISFEKEAYDNEANLDYLETRKWFSFIKYW